MILWSHKVKQDLERESESLEILNSSNEQGGLKEKGELEGGRK